MERDTVDHERVTHEPIVPVVDLVAVGIAGAELPVRGEKCECMRSTDPAHGCAGSAIWDTFVTPGIHPSPATDSSKASCRPAFVITCSSSEHFCRRCHSPTSDDVADDGADDGAAAPVVDPPVEDLSTLELQAGKPSSASQIKRQPTRTVLRCARVYPRAERSMDIG
jgi:hypothetical protein